MSTIKPKLDELDKIDIEIKNLIEQRKPINEKLKGFRERKAYITQDICDYLESKNLPGMRHNGKVILTKTVVRRDKKDADQKQKDAIKSLKDSGVKGNDEELAEILKNVQISMKGEAYDAKKINVKPYREARNRK
jgi:hypothetical protein